MAVLTLNFSARAGSIHYSGNPLWVPTAPTELAGERSLTWLEGKRDKEGTPSPSLWVDVGPSGWETVRGCAEPSLNLASTTYSSDLLITYFPLWASVSSSYIGMNDALPCGL